MGLAFPSRTKEQGEAPYEFRRSSYSILTEAMIDEAPTLLCYILCQLRSASGMLVYSGRS